MNDKMIASLIIIGLGIALLLLMPFAYIWGWNTLFGSLYRIESTWTNWLAVVVLGMFFKNLQLGSKKS